MHRMTSTAALVLLLLGCFASDAAAQFRFRQCGGNTELNMRNINVTPDVVRFPGEIFATVDMSLSRLVESLTLTIDIYRKALGTWIKLPCLFMVGSCDYGDVCTALDRMEKENWALFGKELAKGIRDLVSQIGDDDELCPFRPKRVQFINSRISLPKLPSQLATFVAGDYRIRVQMSEKSNKKLMTCFEMEVTMARGD